MKKENFKIEIHRNEVSSKKTFACIKKQSFLKKDTVFKHEKVKGVPAVASSSMITQLTNILKSLGKAILEYCVFGLPSMANE